jgi:hypothetical protein
LAVIVDEACSRRQPVLIVVQILVSKAMPVTGRGDLWDSEASRIPHFLDGLLTDSS